MDVISEFGGKLIETAAETLLDANPELPAGVQQEAHEGDVDFIAEVTTSLARLAKRTNSLADQVRNAVADGPTRTILGNLGFEAAREAIVERKLMLAAAVGGILRPEFSVERRARLERKLRELDPADVRHLDGITRVPRPNMKDFPAQPGATDDHHAMERLRYAELHVDEFEVLRSSGCVEICRLENYRAEGCRVTRLGQDILRVVEDYVSERTPLSEVPHPKEAG